MKRNIEDEENELKIDLNKKLKIIINDENINSNNGKTNKNSPIKRIKSPSPESSNVEDSEEEASEKSPTNFIPIPGVKLIKEDNHLKNRYRRPRNFIEFDEEENNVILYEMDDSDFDFLQKLNKEENPMINEDLFEKMMTSFEVYWFELRNTNHPKSHKTDCLIIPFRSDESECCVCLNKGYSLINPKKTCKECKVTVHTYCCSLKKENIEMLKKEESSTEIIENNETEEPYTTKCVCGNEKDTDNMIQCDSCGTWQHMKCERIDVDVNLDNKYYKCHACKKIEEDDLDFACYWCSRVSRPQKTRKKNKKNEILDKCKICDNGRMLDDHNSIMGVYYWGNNNKEVAIHTCCAFLATKNLEVLQLQLPVNFAGRKMLETVEKEMNTKKCCFCEKSKGFCVKCSSGDCNRYFHPFCGLQNKVFVDFDSQSNLFEKIDVKHFCKEHSLNKKKRDQKSIWIRTKDYVKDVFKNEISVKSFELLFDHWINLRLIVHKNGVIPLIPLLKVLQRDEVDDDGVGICVYDNRNKDDLVFTLVDDVYHFNYKEEIDL